MKCQKIHLDSKNNASKEEGKGEGKDGLHKSFNTKRQEPGVGDEVGWGVGGHPRVYLPHIQQRALKEAETILRD